MKMAFSKEKWQYFFSVFGHPMDTFYWIRRQEKGSVPIAILLVFLFGCSFSANRLLSSFLVNDVDPRGVNSLFEVLGVMLFYLLICVSNWSITSLMEGEGRMKDIAIAIGYGTFPMTIAMVLSTIVSQFLDLDAAAFYTLIIVIGIAYGAIIMICGIMTVHNFSLGKTVVTLLLTFLAMLIIIFIILLVANMISMVVMFFRSIYTELVYR